MKKKNRQNKKIATNRLLIAVIFICIIVIGFCAWKIAPNLIEDAKSDSEYETAYELYIKPKEASAKAEEESSVDIPDSIADSEPEKRKRFSIDFDSLQGVNEDICAWIHSPGTVINYPVLRGDDNDYYLKRLYTREKNYNGSIFMDYRNSPEFLDLNTVLYGHHMKNGSMFASIVEYRNQEYYEKHPIIDLYTPDMDYEIHVFSAYIAPAGDTYSTLFFNTREEHARFIDEITSLSDIKTDITVEPYDKIVTLATCTYEYDNARYIVHGKLVPVTD